MNDRYAQEDHEHWMDLWRDECEREERAEAEEIERNLSWANMIWFLCHEYYPCPLPGHDLKPRSAA